MLLSEKRSDLGRTQEIKGRAVYNGKPTRSWLNKEDSASPTVSVGSIHLTSVTEAHEQRDVMTGDVPNAHIQTSVPKLKNEQDRVVKKITGILVDMLVEISPSTYPKYVVFEQGKKVLYVHVLKTIYGMLESIFLWYKSSGQT